MSKNITHFNRGLYECRFSLSPTGRARFALSAPLGAYGEGQEPRALDIPPAIQQDFFPRCAWPARTDLKPGWGLISSTKALSRKTRLSIQETIAAMDREFPKNKNPLRIVTFTLPSVDKAAFRALAAWSSYAINRLNTWIGRQLGAHARCGVWEWQKRGALHYHCVIGADDPYKWKGFSVLVKEQWIEILADIGEKTGANMFLARNGDSHYENQHNIQVDTQIIEKSAAAYLSKYLSKGDGIKRDDGSVSKETWAAKKAGEFYAPPRWFNCNSEASRLRKKYTRGVTVARFRVGRIEDAVAMCREFLEMVGLAGYRIIQTEGRGYSAICIYGIVNFDNCIHAIDWMIASMQKELGAIRKVWHGFRRGRIEYSYSPQYWA